VIRRLVGGSLFVLGGAIAVLVAASTSLMYALPAEALAETGADADKGKVVFEQCAACHSLGEPGDYDGPTLKGIVGRKSGSLEDYRYSAAMKRSDVVWDASSLDKYLADPQAFIPGNRMAFAGISEKAQRDDLIAYIAVAAGDAKKN
jgi:cytochrome c